MSREICAKSFLLAGFVGVACGLLFEFIGIGLFFKAEEVEFCKKFILENSSASDRFGSINSIALINNKGSRRVSWSSQDGKSVHGRYCFRIRGSLRKELIQVHWSESNGVKEVTRLSIREGLVATRILWPEAESTSPRPLLSAHIWDGIISLILLVLFGLLYRGFDTGSRWVSFVYTYFNWGERLRGIMKCVFLISVFVAALKSILCFAGLSTLF